MECTSQLTATTITAHSASSDWTYSTVQLDRIKFTITTRISMRTAFSGRYPYRAIALKSIWALAKRLSGSGCRFPTITICEALLPRVFLLAFLKLPTLPLRWSGAVSSTARAFATSR